VRRAGCFLPVIRSSESEVFLFLSTMSALSNLIWLPVSLFSKVKRRTVGFVVFTLLLSILTFFTVASHFPSA
jgi:hypothetical protein